MLIPVQCPCGTCSEWGLIELQGSVQRGDSDPSDSLDSLEVGVLCGSARESFHLKIGCHQLDGLRVALPKPLAVLRRNNNDSLCFEIAGVVLTKIVFKTRPLQRFSSKKNKSAGGGVAAAAAATFFDRRAGK